MSYGLTALGWSHASGTGEPEPVQATTGMSEGGLTVLPADAPAQVARSPLIPVAFAAPLLVSALSYMGGGLPFLSDVAFLMLVVICAPLLVLELVDFNRRLGMGAILIYGGILVWFCHDYASNWLFHDFTEFRPAFANVHADTVAKTLFYHCVFIEVMVIAFRFPVLRFADRAVIAVPEPADSRFYLGVAVALLLVGWAGFLPTVDPLPVSLAKASLWFVPGLGGGPLFTVGRTGNMNYNWGGYVAEVLQVGQIGGIFGAVYALLVARSFAAKLFGWLDWAFWTSYSFTSYRRGDIAFMALPVLGLMFMKFHAQRDPTRRARNFIRLAWTVGLVGLIWVIVQMQTATRYNNARLDLFRAAGNTMFSEGLTMWAVIPDQHPFPYDTWPGEGALRVMPDTLWWFVTGPIPRAIWTTKPIEEFSLWYSASISGDHRSEQSGGVIGTTVSSGAVGAWYFRYGPAGVVEGAALYGWLMGVAERSLRRARGQPLKVMFALGFATFMFRCYRDLWWHNLYPLMIGGVVLWVVIRLLFGSARAGPPAAASGQ